MTIILLFNMFVNDNLRRLILILIIISPVCVYSNAPDSLEGSLDTLEGKEKLEALQALSKSYLVESPDKSIQYGLAAIRLAVELGDREMEALAHKRVGYAKFSKSDYTGSLEHYNVALNIYNELELYFDAAIILTFIGQVNELQGNFDKALQYYIATVKNCDSMIIDETYHESVKQLYANVNISMGNLFHRLDSPDEALYHFNVALKYAAEIQDSLRMAACYSNLGMIYRAYDELDSAFMNYIHALNISIKVGNTGNESAILNNIANIYRSKEKYDSALVYYNMAKTKVIESGNQYGLSLVNRNIGILYVLWGDYNNAVEYFQEAINISNEIGSLQELYLSYYELANVYGLQGDMSSALRYYKQYSMLKDSVTGIEARKEIADIHTKYETEKKEEENILLKKDNEIITLKLVTRNRTILFLAIGIVVVMAFLVVIFMQFKRKKKAYDNLVRRNLEIVETEKDFSLIEKDSSELSGLDHPGIHDLEQSPADSANLLFEKLSYYLINEKPYLKSDLTLDDICLNLDTNRTYLSKVINERFNMNFNSLINEYRIKTSRQLLADSNYNHISIVGIGQMSGFNSKSTFFTCFRKTAGITPSYFRDSLRK